jgi:hypothetical protein
MEQHEAAGAQRAWLVDARRRPANCILEAVKDEDIADLVKRGETIVDAIERYRLRLRELKADIHRVRSSPLPSADAKAQVRAQITALAESARPNVDAAIEHGLPITSDRVDAGDCEERRATRRYRDR